MSDLAALTGRRRKRGRPDRPTATAPRTARVAVRLTETERAELIEAAGGPGGLSELFRAAVFRRAARLRIHIPELNREAWADLARLASNINQLAKAANEGRSGLARDLGHLLTALGEQVAALRRTLISPAAATAGSDAAELLCETRSVEQSIGLHPGINETLDNQKPQGGNNADL